MPLLPVRNAPKNVTPATPAHQRVSLDMPLIRDRPCYHGHCTHGYPNTPSHMLHHVLLAVLANHPHLPTYIAATMPDHSLKYSELPPTSMLPGPPACACWPCVATYMAADPDHNHVFHPPSATSLTFTPIHDTQSEQPWACGHLPCACVLRQVPQHSDFQPSIVSRLITVHQSTYIS